MSKVRNMHSTLQHTNDEQKEETTITLTVTQGGLPRLKDSIQEDETGSAGRLDTLNANSIQEVSVNKIAPGTIPTDAVIASSQVQEGGQGEGQGQGTPKETK